MLFAASVVVLLAFVLSSNAAHGALLRGLSAVERVAAPHPGWAAALVVLFAALAAMLAFLSSWVVTGWAWFALHRRLTRDGRLPEKRPAVCAKV